MAARSRSAVRNWLEYFAVAFMVGTLRWTPRPVAERIGRVYAKLLDVAAPRLRRVAMRNLAMAMPEFSPEEHRRIADGVFRSIARLLVVASRLPGFHRENISEWIEREGVENYQKPKDEGRGVLFCAAHLGAWELGPVAHALLGGEPMYVVVRPLDNPFIDRLVERRREVGGNRIIGKKGFLRSMLEALRSKGTVGILVDQNTGHDDGVFVDFFGIPARCGTAFVKVAHHTGAAVIPAYACWIESEGRFRLKYCPEVEMTGDIVADTARVQAAVEAAIREHPDQWLWVHRRWKTRPDGEPELY